ncbi:MAG TPA: ABC transporter substrate-binding protein, partial [Ideonella sp.]|nr:ABC transporter substrate-binding protein [Ideonella sp.]
MHSPLPSPLFSRDVHPNASQRSTDISRRQVLQAASAAAIGAATGLPSPGAWAQGSDKPEKEEVRIGFIPLTDCASVVMASVLGFD